MAAMVSLPDPFPSLQSCYPVGSTVSINAY